MMAQKSIYNSVVLCNNWIYNIGRMKIALKHWNILNKAGLCKKALAFGSWCHDKVTCQWEMSGESEDIDETLSCHQHVTVFYGAFLLRVLRCIWFKWIPPIKVWIIMLLLPWENHDAPPIQKIMLMLLPWENHVCSSLNWRPTLCRMFAP